MIHVFIQLELVATLLSHLLAAALLSACSSILVLEPNKLIKIPAREAAGAWESPTLASRSV